LGFIGSYFSFDGIPCSEYGLSIYDIGSASQGDFRFASTGEIQESWIPSRGKSHFYGLRKNKPLQFSIVFGIDPQYSDMNDYLDRYEIDAIANWLTGHDKRKWLEITQPDMELVRYNCVITDLTRIDHAWLPWAFSATVTCGSPYGIMHPMSYKYTCLGATPIELFNRSTINQDYYPKMSIELNGSSTISILNQTYGGYELKFEDLPKSSNLTILIDNENKVITSSDSTYPNLYKYFNNNFLPLLRGKNKMLVTGDCIVNFMCEFPVNFGG
jgi:hypothetical protein